jgi:hypothetical protein
MPGLPFNKELHNENLYSGFLRVITNAERAQFIHLEAVDALFPTERIRTVGYKFARHRNAIRIAYRLPFKGQRIEVQIDPTRQTIEFSIWELYASLSKATNSTPLNPCSLRNRQPLSRKHYMVPGQSPSRNIKK